MKIWHYYDLSTGLFDGSRFGSSDEAAIEWNQRRGFGAIDGVKDWESQRVDIETGKLVDYVPPRPGPDHHWDTRAKRWVLAQWAAEKRTRELEIMQAIKGLDERLIRPLIELQISPGDQTAQKVRDNLVREKAILRAELQAIRETS